MNRSSASWILGMLIVVGQVFGQDSLNVRQVGLISYWDRAYSVTVVDTLAFVATYYSGLRIVSIVNPANPVEIGFCDTPGAVNDIDVSGNYVYVADAIGLSIIDFSNPILPVVIGFCPIQGFAFGVAVAENYAYVIEQE